VSTRELLAAKLVGRWRGGAPLTLAPDRDDQKLCAELLRNNDFSYAADPHGRQVPLGSHMRRMNPRDGEMTVLTGLQQDGATFTIPEAPVRRRIHGIETFNVLRGAEYFFSPSLSALKWLGEER
jgi:hypothetical protein